MKFAIRLGLVLVTLLGLTAGAFADTLILKDGTRVAGYYEGGTARVVHFRTDGRLQEYDLLSVYEIQFGQAVAAQPAAPRPRTVEEPRPVYSARSADPELTVPRGSAVVVRLVDQINSEDSQTGQAFRATLAEPLVLNDVEVAPIDTVVRGRIVEAEAAGRINGAAELRLELTQISINGISYSLRTSEYQEVAESRGGQTATRVGAGAGIGALVGLLAGGGKGAAIGAGVGAGTAGAVQVLTKGEKLYIPAETLLEFTLSEPLRVPHR